MRPHFDFFVLGQGLAGTALAWWLRWSGKSVCVVDREASSTSSKVAAGLITPITGQKVVRSWRHAELWPVAISYYERVSRDTGTRFFRQLAMVRVFANNEEVAHFESRSMAGQLDGVDCQQTLLSTDQGFVCALGAFEMNPGGQLNIVEYLRASRESFGSDGGYVATDIDVSRDLELDGSHVRLPRLEMSANRLIFCQGFDAIDNPWFRDVEFKPAKGEILTLKIPGLTEDRVIHQGIWLSPLGADLFKAGSTYDWKQLDSRPTSKGRDEIISKLHQFLRRPFEVISHEAAIRPIHRNQHPVIGVHPVHAQLGYFNGLGSKGSLHAPFFARQFAMMLNEGGKIDPEVDLNLKTKWRSSQPASSTVESHGPNKIFHVKPSTSRSLTEQAQNAIRLILKPGDITVDATAGNGHDTQFLAELVGPRGNVFAFDIQQEALDKTAIRLADRNLQNVVLLNRDHGQMSALLPQDLRCRVGAVMFNLGYLPGGDKRIITNSDSTRTGIEQAALLLRPGGLLTIVAYTGHEGGAAEADTVSESLDKLSREEFEIGKIESQPGRTSGPRMFLVKRLEAERAIS